MYLIFFAYLYINLPNLIVLTFTHIYMRECMCVYDVSVGHTRGVSNTCCWKHVFFSFNWNWICFLIVILAEAHSDMKFEPCGKPSVLISIKNVCLYVHVCACLYLPFILIFAQWLKTMLPFMQMISFVYNLLQKLNWA